MKSEIKIILQEGSSNKAKGNCFEKLVGDLIATHQYKVRHNIRFTGMELDLLAEHKHRPNEVLYVECKAKNKVSSIELRTFFANVFHHNANFGYFFRTHELEYDAGGLLQEYRKDPRYNNLTFFEPEDIIKMLTDSKQIFEPIEELKEYNISKRFLAVTYFGDFLIYLINEKAALPTKYAVIDANKNSNKPTSENIKQLKKSIEEIVDLELIENIKTHIDKPTSTQIIEVESISEVQESENWFDYLPASSSKNHFVGRDEIRTKILAYFKEISNGKSNKRIFYLNGKSGWGKSSLVLEIKNRCRNKHYKNRFYSIAIDTRSAISNNFVAIAFKKLIQNAIDENFIKKNKVNRHIKFTSNTDLLSSESVKSILNYLKENDKFLVLIFDQFEDVFRKQNFFQSFYKFLSDITDIKPNIILGFSWKTDFFLGPDDDAYHIWQQAKEQAREFSVSEFGEKEIDGIIKQLESSVSSLDNSIKNRIKESSQGLPWLTKKLCIHIHDQINSGQAKELLIESNLNIRDLFEKDEERIEAEELKALKLIAKRASEGNFFDESEVGDLVNKDVIASLLNKRLIIRSGANYNIYWDIFRDYLVTGVIPPIGESYLLRQMVNSCIDVFLLFDTNNKSETLDSLISKHPKSIGSDALYNILIELRNIGIVQKDNDTYSVLKNIEISKEAFVNYITKKFQNYTPYLTLKRANHVKINKEIIIQVLKSTFKQEFQDGTWEAYATTLMSWLDLSNIDIKSKLIKPRKGRGKSNEALTFDNLQNSLPKSSFKEIIELIPLLTIDINSINVRYHRDLILLGLIDESKELTEFAKELFIRPKNEAGEILKNRVRNLKKSKSILKDLKRLGKISSKKLVEMKSDDFFDGNKISSKNIYAGKALTWLK